MYSVCWGGCDQSLEWIKARSSLRSKRSVITPLWIQSGFYIPAHGKKTAPCSPFKRYQGLTEGKETCRKHVAHCCLFCGTPKIIPASANNIVSHSHHSQSGFSREHRAELEFRRGIAAINNNYTHSRRFRQNAITFTRAFDSWAHSRALHFCAPTDRDQEQLLIL